MDEGTVIERSTDRSDEWLMPRGGSKLGGMQRFLLHRVCTLSHLLRSIVVRDVLGAFQLDLRDWTVLATLAELGSGTQREISAACKLPQAAVSRAAARLKRRQLVAALPNASDGRSHHLALSNLGRNTLNECSTALVEFEQQALTPFERADLDQANRLLDHLINLLDR